MMRHLSLVAGSVACFAVSLYFIAAAANDALIMPRLICQNPVYDFGEVLAGDGEIDHVFTLGNAGWRQLHILDVSPDCSCSDASVNRKVISHGETAHVYAKLSLKGIRGKVEKSVLLQTNDPRNPWLAVAFRGVVQSRFALDPVEPVLDLRAESGGDFIDLSMANVDGEFSIRRLEEDHDWLDVWSETLQERKRFRIHLEKVAAVRLAQHSAHLMVRTDHPLEPQLLVTIALRRGAVSSHGPDADR